jgi:hypothetical protein
MIQPIVAEGLLENKLNQQQGLFGDEGGDVPRRAFHNENA